MTQRSVLVRALWFVVVGWWVTPIVVNTAWLLNVTVVLFPLGIKLLNLVPTGWQPTLRHLAMECDEVVGAFLRGQLLVMIALGLFYALGLWLIGLDLGVLIGLLSGLAAVVPYLGFIVGIIAASAAAIFQHPEWLIPVLLVWVVYGAGQMLESVVFTPLFVGDRIGLHPVAVIFAVLAGGQLFGFAGVLLALPVAAVVVVLLRHAHAFVTG